jgi:hypothetical protein
VELKLAQSQGEYYLDGVIQAALYRAFIRGATSLAPYFEHYDVDLTLAEAALVVPAFAGPQAAHLRSVLRLAAQDLAVRVIELPPAGLSQAARFPQGDLGTLWTA